MIFPFAWFFNLLTSFLPMTLPFTLPHPLYMLYSLNLVFVNNWNPLYNYNFRLSSLIIISSNFTSWFLPLFQFQQSMRQIIYPTSFSHCSCLHFFGYSFSLNYIANHYTNLPICTLSLFPLFHYIVLICLQSWLKPI